MWHYNYLCSLTGQSVVVIGSRLLLPVKPDETDMVELFLREAVIMKDFEHINVLRIVGVSFETDGSPMVILPYMANADLRQYILNPSHVSEAHSNLHISRLCLLYDKFPAYSLKWKTKLHRIVCATPIPVYRITNSEAFNHDLSGEFKVNNYQS